ncbi:MAG: ABC transporter permease [Symbiobacteriaceae bacterium]|nr:ABC transporter permease [Symbiobacteriaceae bacterium]
MVRYVLGRLVALGVTLFIIVTVSFVAIRYMPGNLYEDPHISPAAMAAINAKYHLDKPVMEQFYYFLRGIVLEGDWGTSIKIRPAIPAFDILRSRIPVSMSLNLISLIISLPLGVVFGTISAMRHNKMIDNVISFAVVICISVPSFVFASMLQYYLGFKFGWFPIIFKASATGKDYALAIVLPILALAVGPIATITRYLRGELIETLSSEFMLLARTKGLTRTQAIIRHAFRNSMVPLLNILVSLFVGILGGSLVIERIFAIPGVGGIMVDAINAMDHPLTIAVLIFYSFVSLIAVLLVDILLGIVDPRIRMGARQ